MAYAVFLLLLVGVVWLVSAPLRHRGGTVAVAGGERFESAERIDLEAARDAKYREIRDAELDHETGKLSDEDFARLDAELRAEAVGLLHALDELDSPPPD